MPVGNDAFEPGHLSVGDGDPLVVVPTGLTVTGTAHAFREIEVPATITLDCDAPVLLIESHGLGGNQAT